MKDERLTQDQHQFLARPAVRQARGKWFWIGAILRERTQMVTLGEIAGIVSSLERRRTVLLTGPFAPSARRPHVTTPVSGSAKRERSGATALVGIQRQSYAVAEQTDIEAEWVPEGWWPRAIELTMVRTRAKCRYPD